jgi:CBS domain-containing protein
MFCRDIMEATVAWVAHGSSVGSVARVMREKGVGLVPVCDPAGKPLGVVTDRDLAVRVCAAGLDPESTSVDEIMTSKVIACQTADDLTIVEELMRQHKQWRVLVVDTEGKLAGLISLTDVVQAEEPVRAARLLRDISEREFRPARQSRPQDPPPATQP